MSTPLHARSISFSHPPITEVVAGVSFEPLGPDSLAVLSGFWQEIARQRFPDFQVQPPYTTPIEQFNAMGDHAAFIPSLQFLGTYPPPRIWAIGDEGQYLLQLQSDWFACNWRKVRPDDEYYRWDRRREDFGYWYGEFLTYLEGRGRGLPRPTQCEVTYINHISPVGDFRSHGDYDNVFKLSIPDLGLRPEQLGTGLRYLIVGTGEDQPVGRLHVDISAALDQKSAPIYILQLTVRGVPNGASQEAVLSFLDLGRDIIDRAFLSLTSDDMHERWGRIHD